MALDLTQTVTQLYDAAPHLTGQRTAKLESLTRAARFLREADPDAIEQRRLAGQTTFLAAGLAPGLAGAMANAYPAPPLPTDLVVVAVDGSHIDVDRHSPVRCFLINIGYVSLHYGELPHADLYSTPRLFVSDHELVIRNPAGNREQPIEGPVLGMLRAVMEIEALIELVEAAPADLPVLALLDGSLILWELAGGAFPDYVRKALLDDRLLPALDHLRTLGKSRTLAIASQISLPRSTDVLNALRVSAPVCRWDALNCDANCGNIARGKRHCDTIAGVTDAELFDAVLSSGERSAVFDTTSSIVQQHYRDHAVRFCYIHLGEELCRLEMPAWSAEGPALELAHSGILSQAQKGHGYPLAIQEAHEQAVVNGADREYFAQLVEEMLASEGLPTGTSQKARSKRTRFI
jgi:hypothetical protein